MVCGCILELKSVESRLWVSVTLTLTSDLVFRIIVSRADLSLILFEVGIANLVCECVLK